MVQFIDKQSRNVILFGSNPVFKVTDKQNIIWYHVHNLFTIINMHKNAFVLSSIFLCRVITDLNTKTSSVLL